MYTLYVNDEYFGHTSYIGTWNEWLIGMADCFRQWYNERDMDEPEMAALSYNEWVSDNMERHLTVADADDITDWPRLDDCL